MRECDAPAPVQLLHMSMEQAVGFLVFALVAAVTPGPSNIS